MRRHMNGTAALAPPVEGAPRFNATRPPSMRRIVVAFVLTLALVLLGCEDPTLGRGITVRNETDVPITFRWIVDGEVVTLAGELSPGDTDILVGAANLGENGRFGQDGCTTAPVVALRPDGEEIARAKPPLCVGDEWVVQSPSE